MGKLQDGVQQPDQNGDVLGTAKNLLEHEIDGWLDSQHHGIPVPIPVREIRQIDDLLQDILSLIVVENLFGARMLRLKTLRDVLDCAKKSRPLARQWMSNAKR